MNWLKEGWDDLVFFYRPSSLVGARLNKHARSLCPLDESILLSLVKQHVRLIYYSADNWHKKQRLVDTDPGNFTRSLLLPTTMPWYGPHVPEVTFAAGMSSVLAIQARPL
jgi:hypothetical protein